MSEVVETALLAVALSCRVDEAQAVWFADTVGTTGCAFAKARLEGDGNSLRKANADEAAGRYRVARADEARRLTRRLDLPPFGGGQCAGGRDGVVTQCGLG